MPKVFLVTLPRCHLLQQHHSAMQNSKSCSRLGNGHNIQRHCSPHLLQDWTSACWLGIQPHCYAGHFATLWISLIDAPVRSCRCYRREDENGYHFLNHCIIFIMCGFTYVFCFTIHRVLSECLCFNYIHVASRMPFVSITCAPAVFFLLLCACQLFCFVLLKLLYCKNWPYTFLPVGNKNAWNHWTIDACIESCVGIRKHRGNVW
jgi:hypothetical protein